MSGKDAIIEKIRADAKEIINSTSEEAVKRGMEIVGKAQENAKIYRDKNMAESLNERKEIIQRKITSANLEVKKLMLSAKQEIIAKAFSEAIDAIRKDKKYPDLLLGMVNEAAEGEIITFSKQDKDLVETKEFSEKLAGKTVSDSYGDFSGGIILSGKGSDKNMTLEVEFASVRDMYEAEIAKILFGE